MGRMWHQCTSSHVVALQRPSTTLGAHSRTLLAHPPLGHFTGALGGQAGQTSSLAGHTPPNGRSAARSTHEPEDAIPKAARAATTVAPTARLAAGHEQKPTATPTKKRNGRWSTDPQTTVRGVPPRCHHHTHTTVHARINEELLNVPERAVKPTSRTPPRRGLAARP